MISKSTTIQQYMDELPTERLEAMTKLRNTIISNLPKGFYEQMTYGMIGYVVPHTLYPKGYHCDSLSPLPFMNIASQKNFIAIYHMAIYCDVDLHNWFIEEYNQLNLKKLDMGKSCMRFKKESDIPYELIGRLCKKLSVNQWIQLYESKFIPKKN
jgi:hypothetical protein